MVYIQEKIYVEKTSQRIIRYALWTLALTVTGYIGYRLCRVAKTEHRLEEEEKVLYDNRYPLSEPILFPQRKLYRIAVVADLDKERSKSFGKPFEWHSYLKKGFLILHNDGRYQIEFTESLTLTTNLNEKGRGLELSELCVFNNKLYTADDRTGIIYEIIKNEPIPWAILQDGDGKSKKGFKSEWMTVKDGKLHVGSVGKEFTSRTGKFLNNNPMFIKTITPGGEVKHLNWSHHYKRIRTKLGLKDPGYVMHEAATWSNIKQKWFFLPRRMSALRYDDELDENRGTNVLISASSDFEDMKVIFVGDLDVTHGFSSFKFIPDTDDNLVIALKTKEVGNDISSYITIFDVNTGHTVMQEQAIAKDKYEGIEFL